MAGLRPATCFAGWSPTSHVFSGCSEPHFSGGFATGQIFFWPASHFWLLRSQPRVFLAGLRPATPFAGWSSTSHAHLAAIWLEKKPINEGGGPICPPSPDVTYPPYLKKHFFSTCGVCARSKSSRKDKKYEGRRFFQPDRSQKWLASRRPARK